MSHCLISGVSLGQWRADQAAASRSKAELYNQICSLLATGMTKAEIYRRLRTTKWTVQRAVASQQHAAPLR